MSINKPSIFKDVESTKPKWWRVVLDVMIGIGFIVFWLYSFAFMIRFLKT